MFFSEAVEKMLNGESAVLCGSYEERARLLEALRDAGFKLDGGCREIVEFDITAYQGAMLIRIDNNGRVHGSSSDAHMGYDRIPFSTLFFGLCDESQYDIDNLFL